MHQVGLVGKSFHPHAAEGCTEVTKLGATEITSYVNKQQAWQEKRLSSQHSPNPREAFCFETEPHRESYLFLHLSSSLLNHTLFLKNNKNIPETIDFLGDVQTHSFSAGCISNLRGRCQPHSSRPVPGAERDAVLGADLLLAHWVVALPRGRLGKCCQLGALSRA